MVREIGGGVLIREENDGCEGEEKLFVRKGKRDSSKTTRLDTYNLLVRGS